MTQTTTTRVPIRLSDIDGYGHVNNATMLSLVEHAVAVEARRTTVPRRMNDRYTYELTVDYLQPITMANRCVLVTSHELDGANLYELGVETTAGVTTCARVRVSPTPRTARGTATSITHPITVRPGDLKQGAVLTFDGTLNVVQESRFAMVQPGVETGDVGAMAVATVSARVTGPVTPGIVTLPALTWVDRVGRASLHVRTEIADGLVNADTVLVAIDPDSGDARPWTSTERDYFYAAGRSHEEATQ